jgi:hypothetical protein
MLHRHSEVNRFQNIMLSKGQNRQNVRLVQTSKLLRAAAMHRQMVDSCLKPNAFQDIYNIVHTRMPGFLAV